MVRMLQGGNSMSDQLRQQLVESAAQRFLQRSQPPAPIPDIDYAGALLPAVSQIAQSGLGAFEQYQQNQQRQQSIEQQAQAVSQQYQIPYEQALQIVDADPALQKSLLAGLQKGQEQEFQLKRDELKSERSLAGAITLEELKQGYAKANSEIKQMADNDEKKAIYERANSAASRMMKYANKIKNFDNRGFLSNPLGGERDFLPEITLAVNDYVDAQGKLHGMTADAQKTMKQALIDQIYASKQSMRSALNEISGTNMPSNFQNIQSELAQNFPQIINQEESSEGGVGEGLAHKAAVLGSSALAGITGLPGDIQQMGNAPVSGLGQGLPLGYLNQLENMDPELIKQIEAQRAQETPEQTAAAQQAFFPGELPTYESMKERIGSVLPEGFLDNRDVIDAGLETLGKDLPIIALTGFAEGVGALMKPVMRSVFGGATQDALKRAGYSPAVQFFGGVGAGMLIDKGSRIMQDKTIESRQTFDLKKPRDEMYEAARVKGANTQVPMQAFKERYNKLFTKVGTPESGLTREATSDVTHALKNFESFANAESVSLPDVIEAQKGLNESMQGLGRSAKAKLADLNKGLNESIALVPDAPGVREYNIGKNIHGAINNMNVIEEQLYRLPKMSSASKIGASLASTYVASLLGLPKAKMLGLGIGATLAGSSAYRQLNNLYNLPQARKAAMGAITELVSGNTAKGQRNLVNLTRIAAKVVKEDKDND